MSNDNVPPAIREMFRSSDRRLKELERRFTGLGLADAVAAGGDRFPGVSFPAELLVDAESPPWYSTRAISYVSARISARVAGGGNGTVAIQVNGSTVLSVTLASGELTHVYAAVFSVGVGGEIGVLTTAAGGQSIVSVQLVEAE